MFWKSFVLHSVFIALLLLFYPVRSVYPVAMSGFIFWAWTVYSSYRSFGEIRKNLYLRSCFSLSIVIYCVLGLIGSSYQGANGNRLVLAILLIIGFSSLSATFHFGFRRGKAVYMENSRVAYKSFDWNGGLYDVRSNSMEAVDVYRGILESFPTWKALFLLAFILSPGPFLVLLAGKISNQAQLIVVIPAYWGAAMVFGALFLRTVIEYSVVREMEAQKGKRIFLSTSLIQGRT